MATLIKYDAACRALAAAKAVDEVKDLRDKAEAMRIYGMQANNKALEVDAAEIRIRAERRLGELIAAQKSEAGLATGSRGQLAGKGPDGLAVVTDDRQKIAPTLAEAGISKDLSSRSQKLAAVPEDEFEAEVGEWRERVKAEGKRVTTRLEQAGEKAMARKAEKPAKPDPVAKLRARVAELEAEIERLRTFLAGAEDAAQQAVETAANLEAIASGEEAKRLEVLTAKLRAAEARKNELMNENAALKRQIKAMQRTEKRAA